MKKSTLIFNLARAAFIILAYQHLVTPKAALVPPGTLRHNWKPAKSAVVFSLRYLKSLLRQRLSRRQLPA